MGVPKRLTEMQKRFAEFIVFGGPDGPVSQGEAAKLAGYSEKRCRQEGSELMNPRLSPLVAQYVGSLKEERLKKFEVSYENHVAELARIKEMALKKGSFSSAVNAETNRGKAAGLYIDRKIIKTGKLEDMSEAELEAKMKQILDDYAPLLNAQTVEGEAIEAPKSSESSSQPKSESSSGHRKKKSHHLPDQKKQTA
jgi:phage terminase small subunit|tara:strand:+ start:703 stop:1290 length:588 start_codon:yes stop_codon:yes gene_type:complete